MIDIVKASEVTRPKGTILIYGAPGTGKTSTVRYFSGKTLVIDVDKTSHVLRGIENIDICYVDTSNAWNSWQTILLELVKSYKGKYDQIVVDNISELERAMLADRGKSGKNEGVPSMADYQKVQFRLLNSLRYLKQMETTIVLTAWEMTDSYEDINGQTFSRAYPQLSKTIMNNVMGLCDVVGRIMINKDGERGFTFTSTSSTFAKDQLYNRKGCKQDELLIERIPEDTNREREE